MLQLRNSAPVEVQLNIDEFLYGTSSMQKQTHKTQMASSFEEIQKREIIKQMWVRANKVKTLVEMIIADVDVKISHYYIAKHFSINGENDCLTSIHLCHPEYRWLPELIISHTNQNLEMVMYMQCERNGEWDEINQTKMFYHPMPLNMQIVLAIAHARSIYYM